MLNLGRNCRIWLYTPACDMRRSSDGFSALVRNELGADPTYGHWYVFAALGIGAVPTEEVRYRRSKKRRDGAVNERDGPRGLDRNCDLISGIF